MNNNDGNNEGNNNEGNNDFSGESGWGKSFDIDVRNGVPELDILLLAEQDRINLAIPGIRFVKAVQSEVGGDIVYTYSFGDPTPVPKKYANVPALTRFGTITLSFVFSDNDTANRIFSRKEDPEQWKNEQNLNNIEFVELMIDIPNRMHITRAFGDLDIDNDPDLHNAKLMGKLNCALLQYKGIQDMVNQQREEAIGKIAPAIVEYQLRPPGITHANNTGGILYKQGKASFYSDGGRRRRSVKKTKKITKRKSRRGRR